MPGILRLQAESALDEVPLPESPVSAVLSVLFASEAMPVANDFEDLEAQRLWCAAAAAEPKTGEEAEQMVRKRVASLRRTSLEMEQARMEAAIRAAERENPAVLGSLLNELFRISRSIESLDPV